MKTRLFLVLTGLWLITDVMIGQSYWEQVPEKVRQRKAYKRYEWFYRQRALPYDTIPYDKWNAEREKEMTKKSIETAGLTWAPIGPAGVVSTWPSQWGVVSGRVRAIAVHPTNPQIVYLGVSSGGLWKSTNGGDSWIDVGGNLPSMTYGAIALDPANPNTVYAGSGEWIRYFNLNTYDGKGLYKSTDGGSNWTQITNGFGTRTHFTSIRVSPHNSNVVFASLGSGYWLYSNPGNEGVWRSTDAGITWSRVLNVNDAFEVVPHPTIANRVYACVGGGSAASGLYLSTNNGTNWDLISAGLPLSTSIDRLHLAIPSGNPSIMYTLIYSGAVDSMWLYKSTNGGNNWFPTPARFASGQGWYDLLLGVNHLNPNEVYIGDAELRRSTNGGQSFAYVGGSYWNQSMHVDFHYMTYAPSDTSVRYIGCDGGIYRSTNAGSNWHHRNNGLTTLQYYRISSHPINANIMLGGAQDNGLYRTTNGGSGNWDLVSTGDGMESFFDYTNGNVVYAATQNGAFVKSTSGGSYGTFFSIAFSPPGQSFSWTAPFFMHPSNNTILFTAAYRPYKSTNGGSSWFPMTTSDLTNAPIVSFDVSRVNPDYMIIGGTDYASNPPVFISINGGSQWTTVTSNIPGAARYISRVVCHPTKAATMFIVRSGFGSGKIYRTTNAGASWQDISSNLPDVPHNDLFIDPEIPEVMYTANDLGVYVTTNSGTSWARENALPFVPAIDFSYVKIGSNRILRVATHGRSAFQAYLPRNKAPYVIQSLPDTVLPEDFSKTFYRYLTPAFADSDGTPLTFSAQILGQGVVPIISNDSLYLLSVPDFFGTAVVRIVASDGSLQISDTFRVNVTNINDAPGIPVILYPAPMDSFYSDTLMVMWRKTSDADQDPLQYFWSLNGPMVSTSGSTGDTLIRIGSNFVSGTAYIFSLRAYDGIDSGGISSVTVFRGSSVDIDEKQYPVPKDIILFPNYPNPANPITTIRFGLPSAAMVRITIYNIFGQQVKTLTHARYKAGYHAILWDATNDQQNIVSSGIYIYRLQTPAGVLSRKMVLLK